MMPDREKVIKGLECCNAPNNHDDCPYNGDNHYNVCTHKLLCDALELLKEQEAVKVQYTAMGGLRYGACPQCDARVDNLVNPKACGFCGQELKWE